MNSDQGNQQSRAARPCRLLAGMAAVLVGLTAVGCGDDETAASDGAQSADQPAVALREATVPDGIVVVPVDRLMRRPDDHVGRLAVEGVVVQSVPERGALLLVDLDEFKSCGLAACTDASMPVRIDAASYEGSLPQPGQLVTMIGDFAAAERGFIFELLEIHREGGVILARREAAAP